MLFLDGIHLARNVVVPMAASEDHVVAWYIAQSESSRAWGALMARVPPPLLVITDGGSGLARARDSLMRLIREEALFTYLVPALTQALGPLPALDNRIEGGVNAQLRAMPGEHRGLSLLRRAKAVFWWCHVHTEDPPPAAEILRAMPIDTDIAELYAGLAW